MAVLAFGWLLLALLAVSGPAGRAGGLVRAAPTAVAGELIGLIRRRLLTVALLMAAVGLLAGAVGAVMSFIDGRRAGSPKARGRRGRVDVPAQQLMAGLFGYGLRSLGAAGAPVAGTAHGAAALVGGGVRARPRAPGPRLPARRVRGLTWRCAGGPDRDAAACRPALDGRVDAANASVTARAPCRTAPTVRATIPMDPTSRWSRCWRSSTRRPCRSTSTSPGA